MDKWIICFLLYRLTDNAAENPSTLSQWYWSNHSIKQHVHRHKHLLTAGGERYCRQSTLSMPLQGTLTPNRQQNQGCVLTATSHAAIFLPLLTNRYSAPEASRRHRNTPGARPEHSRNTAGTWPEHGRKTSTLYSTCEDNKIPGIINIKSKNLSV